ncbi:hypothetical protein G5V58_00260 [Nocardioides anomalus]|uniref:CBU-0592-like domain-containing protein n=1 Tax=Nocardioides anomalus TaxID=2712223 RepID=A0A6G6W8N8_9ACTN|nr:hypothetical protein [Nocardioides anomalus]QIG41410.1 hypothetical protein G5V58_00260 [Nocardioides anomalus]
MIAAAMGWIGTVGSISAYVLLSRGRWHAQSLRYSALNGVAGVLAASASAVYGAWPSVTSNLLWSLIAAQAAYTELRRRHVARLAAVVTPLPTLQHDPEPPTGPQPVLVSAA